jgi:hypothetical protein
MPRTLGALPGKARGRGGGGGSPWWWHDTTRGNPLGLVDGRAVVQWRLAVVGGEAVDGD